MVNYGMEAAHTIWRIGLFGGLTARCGDRTIAGFPNRKSGVVLALLALHMPHALTREELIDALWPDADTDSGRNRLNQILSRLRTQFDTPSQERQSLLYSDGSRVGLNPHAVRTDVAAYLDALGDAKRSASPAEHAEALARAIDLYEGDLLPGYYDSWILARRSSLQESYIAAIRQLVAILGGEGRFDLALGYARRAVEVDPLREETHLDVMKLLAAQGEPAAALRTFAEMTRILTHELNAEPSADAVALRDRVERSSPPPASPVRPLTVPAPLTRFFGRRAEIEQIRRAIVCDGERLISLVGVAGAGKTRLALEVAASLEESRRAPANARGRTPDSLLFVSLTDLNDASAAPSIIADALGLKRTADISQTAQVAEALSAGRFLLLLDNLEHLTPAIAPFIRHLLTAAPELTILATSRQRIGLQGEHQFSVPPLSLPGSEDSADALPQSDSVQLFVDRARTARPDFTITAANASAVRELALRLEGIPLAIELCAAWAQTLTPAQMLAQFERRFELLVRTDADAPPRHLSLHSALEYSYRQLSPWLQTLFSELSVFRGGWTLEVAEAVCSNPAERGGSARMIVAHRELQERSLLGAEEVSGIGIETEMRYRMLESLREFGDEQLTDDRRDRLRHAHAAYILRLAERAERGLAGQDFEGWLTRLDRDLENVNGALAWSLASGDPATAARIGTALHRYWYTRGRLQDGGDWIARALAAAEGRPEALAPDLRARAWTAIGHLAWGRGDYAAARSAHEQALALRREAGDDAGIAESLYHLGITAYRETIYGEAQAYLDESLAISRRRGDAPGVARALLNLGNVADGNHDLDRAEALYRESLHIEQSLGNRQRVADALNNLGLIARSRNDFERAYALFEETLKIRRELTDNYGAAIALSNLGAIARLQGRSADSWSLLVEGLQLASSVGNKHIAAHYFLLLGFLAHGSGKDRLSVYLLSVARSGIDAIGSHFSDAYQEEYERTLQAAGETLNGETFAAAWREGQTATIPQALRQASWESA